jgi:hypothetical protein
MQSYSDGARGLGKRILLAAAATIVALLVFEIGLSWLAPVEYRRLPENLGEEPWRNGFHRPSTVPGLVYELVPDRRGHAMGTRVETNRYGMRDDDTPPPGTPGRQRVVVLGDSFTFGFGVEADAAYPNVLERLLRDDGAASVDVLNLGVGGYGARDVSAAFLHKGMPWKPVLAVVGYVLNDPETEPIQPLHTYFAEPRCWQHSNVARLLVAAHREWQIRRLGGGDYLRYLHAPGQPKWESVVRAFGEMGREAKAEGLPVLVLIFPVPAGTSWSRYPYRDLHDQVARAARDAGLQPLDLLERFSVYPPGQLFTAYDDHPNELAHRLAAEAIREWMRENLP